MTARYRDLTTVRIGDMGAFVVPRDTAVGIYQIAEAAAKMLGEFCGDRVEVKLRGWIDRKKISAIKFVRQCTGSTLRDAKFLCDRAENEPQLIGHYTYNEAVQMVEEAKDEGVLLSIPSPLELLAKQVEE